MGSSLARKHNPQTPGHHMHHRQSPAKVFLQTIPSVEKVKRCWATSPESIQTLKGIVKDRKEANERQEGTGYALH
jgi:hypothetical protein